MGDYIYILYGDGSPPHTEGFVVVVLLVVLLQWRDVCAKVRDERLVRQDRPANVRHPNDSVTDCAGMTRI